MESFARVLWGIVPLWAGGGDIDGFSDIYTKGLSAGTNPAMVGRGAVFCRANL